MALGAGVVAVVVNMTPNAADMVAVIGAMLATVIAVLDARKRDRTLGNTVSVVIGSAVVGSIAPGAVLWNIWPQFAATMSWHVWAAMGFVAGLAGWSAVLAATSVLRARQSGLLENVADRILGPKRESSNPSNKPNNP